MTPLVPNGALDNVVFLVRAHASLPPLPIVRGQEATTFIDFSPPSNAQVASPPIVIQIRRVSSSPSTNFTTGAGAAAPMGVGAQPGISINASPSIYVAAPINHISITAPPQQPSSAPAAPRRVVIGGSRASGPQLQQQTLFSSGALFEAGTKPRQPTTNPMLSLITDDTHPHRDDIHGVDIIV